MTVDINNISHETNDANMIQTNDMGKSKRDGNIYMNKCTLQDASIQISDYDNFMCIKMHYILKIHKRYIAKDEGR